MVLGLTSLILGKNGIMKELLHWTGDQVDSGVSLNYLNLIILPIIHRIQKNKNSESKEELLMMKIPI